MWSVTRFRLDNVIHVYAFIPAAESFSCGASLLVRLLDLLRNGTRVPQVGPKPNAGSIGHPPGDEGCVRGEGMGRLRVHFGCS